MKAGFTILSILLYSTLLSWRVLAPVTEEPKDRTVWQEHFISNDPCVQSTVLTVSASSAIVTVIFTPSPVLKWQESYFHRLRTGWAAILKDLKYDRYSIRDYQIKTGQAQRLFPFHHFW